MAKIPFSLEALKNAVRRRPVLYDYTNRNHFKKTLRTKAWDEVANLFLDEHVTGEYCQSEFSRLRDNRSQRVRRQKKKHKSGAAGGSQPENFQCDDLAWLDEVGRDMSGHRESSLRMGPQNASGSRACSITFQADRRGVIQQPGVIDDCCGEVQRVNERIEEERNLREPPQVMLPLVLSPRIRRLVSAEGNASEEPWSPRQPPNVMSTPTTRTPRTSPGGSRRSRSGRIRRAPNRYSPSESLSSRLNYSNASSVGSAASLNRRRRSRVPSRMRSRNMSPLSPAASDFTVQDQREPLATIDEQEAEGVHSLGGPQADVASANRADPTDDGRRDEDAVVLPGDVGGARNDITSPLRLRIDPVEQGVQVSPRQPPRITPIVEGGGLVVDGGGSPRRSDATVLPRGIRIRRRSPQRLRPVLLARRQRPRVIPIVEDGGLEADGGDNPDSPDANVLPPGNRRRASPQRQHIEPEQQQGQQGLRAPRRQRPLTPQGLPEDRALNRRERAEDRERQQRQLQLEFERRREALRDNIRAQVEARRINLQRQPEAPAQQNVQGAEGADIALLRQFLTEKDMDAYGHFGQTVASMLRAMPPAVSGKAMVDIMILLDKLANDPEERENFLTSDYRTW